MANGSVTMSKIAQVAGVSQPLVSKVLCGGGTNIRVGEETAKKIQSVALDLGYFANTAARAMRSGSFNCISLLQSSFYPHSMLPQQLLHGIQEELTKRGKHLVLSELTDEKLISEGFIPKILTELFADGLLVNYNTRIPEKMVKLINEHHIPSVWINSKQENNCVYPDDFQGATLATEHLLELGHQRIAFARYTGGTHYSAQDRGDGYSNMMKKAGLSPQIFKKELDLHDVGGLSLDILSAADRPTAIICYTEKEFLGLAYAANQLGLKIPNDLSLVVFNPFPFEQVGMFATTVLLPEQEIGHKAVDLLLKRIENPTKDFDPVSVKGSLVVKDTSKEYRG